MRSYFQGLITGALLVFSLFIFMGQQDLQKAEERSGRDLNGLQTTMRKKRIEKWVTRARDVHGSQTRYRRTTASPLELGRRGIITV